MTSTRRSILASLSAISLSLISGCSTSSFSETSTEEQGFSLEMSGYSNASGIEVKVGSYSIFSSAVGDDYEISGIITAGELDEGFTYQVNKLIVEFSEGEEVVATDTFDKGWNLPPLEGDELVRTAEFTLEESASLNKNVNRVRVKALRKHITKYS